MRSCFSKEAGSTNSSSWRQSQISFSSSAKNWCRLRNQVKNKRPLDEAFNRCTTCGVTEKSNPRMEFRYCAQCAGTACYCIDHIHVHAHRGASKSVEA
jgi:hypothetical protein